VALVLEQEGVLLAVARYDRLEDPTQAEVAFVVADEFQHHGIATLLLHQLALQARGAGVTHLVAEVLAENKPMLSVFHGAGFPIQSKSDWGTICLTMCIVPTGSIAVEGQTGTHQTNLVPPPSAV
jgi:GNAT superfamily N-acetyltransferase